MTQSIRTITEPEHLVEVFHGFFTGKNAFLKLKTGSIKVQYLGFSEGQAAFRIPFVKSIPEKVTIFAREHSSTIYTLLKFLERAGDTFVFQPLTAQIVLAERRQERHYLPADANAKRVVQIENLLTESSIGTSMLKNERTVDAIRKAVLQKFSEGFEFARIFLIHEAQNDARMNYFRSTPLSLLVPDVKTRPADEGEAAVYDRYIAEIYKKDHRLATHRNLVAEISVPLIHAKYLSYGYIQINHSRPLAAQNLSTVEKVARAVENHFATREFFVPSPEKFLVSDLSLGGTGIVYRERKLARYFQVGARALFDLCISHDARIFVCGIIRNVTFLENAIIKTGIEFVDLDGPGREILSQFIGSMKTEEAERSAPSPDGAAADEGDKTASTPPEQPAEPAGQPRADGTADTGEEPVTKE